MRETTHAEGRKQYVHHPAGHLHFDLREQRSAVCRQEKKHILRVILQGQYAEFLGDLFI